MSRRIPHAARLLIVLPLIASGFADPAIVTQTVVLSALIGACIWNLITWWYGIPSSSSHALIGALAGAVVAKAGVSAFRWGALKDKVLVPLVVSPTLGFIAAFILMIALVWAIRGIRMITIITRVAGRWCGFCTSCVSRSDPSSTCS